MSLAKQTGRPIIALTLLYVTTLITVGCSQAPPPPDPLDHQRSAVGISLKMREGPLRMTSKAPEVVLFARIEEGEGMSEILAKDKLIPSTFADGEQVYLLNAPPGTYVAVAAIYAVEQEATEVPVGSQPVGSNVEMSVSVDMFGGADTYRNYFCKELIEQTQITVAPHSFAFMGRYETNQSSTFGDGDEAQKHFLLLLEGTEKAAGFVGDLFSSDHARRLSPHKADLTGVAEAKFYTKARKHLEGTAWVGMIDETMAEL